MTPRIRIVDVAVAAVVLAVLSISAMVSSANPNDRAPDVWGWLLLVTVAVLTVLRRRWPIVVLVMVTLLIFGYYMAGYRTIGLELPLAAPVFSVAATGRWRFAGAWALTVTAFAYFSRWRIGQDPVLIVALQLPTTAAVLIGSVAWGDAVHSRRQLRLEQDERLAAVRREAEQAVVQRAADERLALARDLHDVLGHTLSVVSLHGGLADEALVDGDAPAARASVAVIREASASAMRDLRGTLAVLRGGGIEPLHPVGDLAQLDELVTRTRASGVTVEASVDADPLRVPASAGLIAYRVVQEALTNVLRHARATRAVVAVRLEGSVLVVEVTDDGDGLAGSPAHAFARGTGLRGLAERVAVVSGELTVDRSHAGGVLVRAVIPT